MKNKLNDFIFWRCNNVEVGIFAFTGYTSHICDVFITSPNNITTSYKEENSKS
ncbi:Uncharacterised protein [Sphingobacterium spiritivorum]|nr:Uncharacterised protein [Sphingobacterium spiritivorum]